MTIVSSGAISLGSIQTEYSGSDPIGINEYYRGAGYVASHQRNTAIPTSGTIAVGNFYGTQKLFSSDTYTPTQYQTTSFISGGGGYTNYLITRYDGCGTDGVVSLGGMGTIVTVGQSVSSTATATIKGFYDFYQGINSLAYVSSALLFTGSVTGTWWNSVTINGRTKNRTAAGTTSGTYNSTYNYTAWAWNTDFNLQSLATFAVSFT